QPLPSRRTRDLVRVQFANALSEVSRVRRHEAGEKRYCAANRGIWWRVIRFPREIGNFEAVRIDGHVPRLCQIQGRPSMIPMSMREQNRFGSRSGAKS